LHLQAVGVAPLIIEAVDSVIKIPPLIPIPLTFLHAEGATLAYAAIAIVKNLEHMLVGSEFARIVAANIICRGIFSIAGASREQ
jgi:hypothetical protein